MEARTFADVFWPLRQVLRRKTEALGTGKDTGSGAECVLSLQLTDQWMEEGPHDRQPRLWIVGPYVGSIKGL